MHRPSAVRQQRCGNVAVAVRSATGWAPARWLNDNDSQYSCSGDAVCGTHRHPERAQLMLSRLRDVGPSHRRWSVPLGVHRPQRCFTPGDEILLEVVHCLAITPGCRAVGHVTDEFIPLSFWYDAPLISRDSDRRHDSSNPANTCVTSMHR